MDLMIDIPLALLVFNFPLCAYELGQFIGPRLGGTIFEAIHPEPLGKMVYTKSVNQSS